MLDLSSELGVDVGGVQTHDDGGRLVARVELVFPEEVYVTDRQDALERLIGGDPTTEETANGSEKAAPATEPRPESAAEADSDSEVIVADEREDDTEGEDGEERRTGSEQESVTEDEPSGGRVEQDVSETFLRCEVPDCDRSFGTEHGMRIHVGRVHRSADSENEGDGADGADSEERAAADEDGPGEETGEVDAEPNDDSQVALLSGLDVDLPDELEVKDLTAALETSVSLREVANELGLGRAETRDLLSGLGLLDLVHGRVATAEARRRSRADIRHRLRKRTANS